VCVCVGVGVRGCGKYIFLFWVAFPFTSLHLFGVFSVVLDFLAQNLPAQKEPKAVE